MTFNELMLICGIQLILNKFSATKIPWVSAKLKQRHKTMKLPSAIKYLVVLFLLVGTSCEKSLFINHL